MKYSGNVKGNLSVIEGDDISELRSVSGYVYVRGEFDAPMLDTAGNLYVYVG